MDKQRTKFAAIDLTKIAIFTALMVVGAFIKIPFPAVPLTFQTVFCILAGLMLGWKKGSIAMLIYLIMGLIGIPVFTAGGGVAYVVKPSFGYIIGFILGALVAGIVRGKNEKISIYRYLLASLAGVVANYVIGIIYFIIVWKVNEYPELGSAIVSYNLIYIPKDLILCALAAVAAWKVTPMVARIGLGKNNEEKQKLIESEDNKDDSNINI